VESIQAEAAAFQLGLAAEGSPHRDEVFSRGLFTPALDVRSFFSSSGPPSRALQFLKCFRMRLERRGFAGRLPWLARLVRRRGLAMSLDPSRSRPVVVVRRAVRGAAQFVSSAANASSILCTMSRHACCRASSDRIRSAILPTTGGSSASWQKS